MTAVAWVESPLQALSVVEAQAKGDLDARTEVVVRPGIPALDETVAYLRTLDLPEGLGLGSDAGKAKPSAAWVIGDPFSGVVQRALLRRRWADVVVVDDGAATTHFLSLLAEGAPLVRARAMGGVSRRVLGAASCHVLRRAAVQHRLMVVTAYDVPRDVLAMLGELGVRVRRHAFEWVRGQPAAEAPRQSTVLLGSAVVADGLVHSGRYLDWVAERAREGPLAYFPHRREDAGTLEPLKGLPDVEVRPAGVPVELSLRGLGPRHNVVCLPSSTATTMRLVLAGRGTSVDVHPVEESWWTPDAPLAVRALTTAQIA